MDMDEDLDCPLCMEKLDETDRNFKPCVCEYQVRTCFGARCVVGSPRFRFVNSAGITFERS